MVTTPESCSRRARNECGRRAAHRELPLPAKNKYQTKHVVQTTDVLYSAHKITKKSTNITLGSLSQQPSATRSPQQYSLCQILQTPPNLPLHIAIQLFLWAGCPSWCQPTVPKHHMQKAHASVIWSNKFTYLLQNYLLTNIGRNSDDLAIQSAMRKNIAAAVWPFNQCSIQPRRALKWSYAPTDNNAIPNIANRSQNSTSSSLSQKQIMLKTSLKSATTSELSCWDDFKRDQSQNLSDAEVWYSRV